jgi:hypothetical protein
MAATGKSKTCVWRWQERFMHEGVDGKVKSAASGRTGPDGKVYFSSYRVRSRGCQRLTVMDIKMAGYAFDKSHPQYGEICGLDMQP